MSSEPARIPVEDAPEPVAPAPAAPPPPPAAPPVEDDADLGAIDLKDEARVKGLLAELGRKRAENRTMKAQVEHAAAVEAELAEARPYVDFLRHNPQLLQPTPEPRPAPPDADPDALEAARLMDFYKQDGTPDVDRGAKWLALQDRRAGRVAQQQIAPTVQQTLQDRAAANYQMLRSFKLQDGSPLKPEIVDSIWTMAAREPNGMQTLANPDSVRALALLALGAQTLSAAPRVAPPAQDPVITEAGGGRGAITPQTRLSAIESRVLAQRGMSAEDYAKHTKDFQPGRSNILED